MHALCLAVFNCLDFCLQSTNLFGRYPHKRVIGMRIFRLGPRQGNGSDLKEAFARADLIAVLAVVAVVGTLHFAALGNQSITADAAVCLSNFKRLIRGWQLYADDNGGRLARAYHGSFTTPPDPGWIGGWLTWDISTHNTNTLFLIDDRWSLLGAYVGQDAAVFHCPADQFVSQVQRLRGLTHRVRNVSGNIGIGGVNTDTGPLDPIYKRILTVSDFIFPSPAETWVHLEEHPDSVNDAAFFNPQANWWIDQPGTFHAGATTFSFADGHVEIHRWQDSLSIPRFQAVRYSLYQPPIPRAGDLDVHWMSYRAGRNSTNSY